MLVGMEERSTTLSVATLNRDCTAVEEEGEGEEKEEEEEEEEEEWVER